MARVNNIMNKVKTGLLSLSRLVLRLFEQCEQLFLGGTTTDLWLSDVCKASRSHEVLQAEEGQVFRIIGKRLPNMNLHQVEL